MNAPELLLEDTFYYRAYIELDTCRNYELGPIPYSAISQYKNDYDIDDEQFEGLLVIIRKVDNWQLEEIGKKLNGKRPKVPSKNNA